MAKDRKRISAAGFVCWRRLLGDEREVLLFVPAESIGYGSLLVFFSEALADLREYGKATRHLTDLSLPEHVSLLGPREDRTRLIQTIALRSDTSLAESSMSFEEGTLTCSLNEAGLFDLVEATRLQAESTKQFFHGSGTTWGFGFAIDWAGAE